MSNWLTQKLHALLPYLEHALLQVPPALHCVLFALTARDLY